MSKLAATVASRILADVMAQDWPVGEVFGSEAELLEQYGVSRAVFREAVRLVEHQQVATMRRGPGGGLIVAEPSAEAIIDASVLYFHLVDARLDEVFEARLALETLAAGLASQRLDEADLLRVRALMDAEASGEAKDHRALHSLLAALSRNPALELFVDLLNRVMLLYFDNTNAVASTTLDASAHAHERIARAVIDGDEGLARRRMRTHLEAEADYLRRRRSAHQLLDPSVAMAGPAGNKRAEQVARGIFRDVAARDLSPGTLLGSEADLTAQYEVSRAVFREAVRILEHHQIAAMRRGPGGGLFVVPPSAAAVTDVVAIYLARHGTTVEHLTEVRVGVELALIDLLVDRMNEERAAELRAALPDAGSNGQVVQTAHDLHATIAALAGNRALELLCLVLIRLTRLHQVGDAATRNRTAPEISRAHEHIVAAIVDRDRELARHRMRRHLTAMATHLA